MNRIILIGRLATDPELKYTPSGVAVTDFRLAVDRPYKSQSGEKETDFITIKVWREQAENVANYMTKGRLVAVDGRLEIRTWVSQQDGTKRSAAEVVAERVQFLDRAPQADGDAPRGEGAPRPSGGYQERPPAAARPGNFAPAAASPGPAYAGAAAGGAAEEADFGDPFAEE